MQLGTRRNHIKELKQFYMQNQHKFIPDEVKSELKLRDLLHELEQTASKEIDTITEMMDQGSSSAKFELSTLSHREEPARQHSFISLEGSQFLMSRFTTKANSSQKNHK